MFLNPLFSVRANKRFCLGFPLFPSALARCDCELLWGSTCTTQTQGHKTLDTSETTLIPRIRVSLPYFLMQVCVNMQACVVEYINQDLFTILFGQFLHSWWIRRAKLICWIQAMPQGLPPSYGKPWFCIVFLFCSLVGNSSRFPFFKVGLKIINARKGWSALLFMFMQMQRCFRKPSRSSCEQLWHIKFKKLR